MFVDKFIFKKHLEEGESVLFAAHKHWTQLFPYVLNVIFFGLMLPWVIYSAGFRSDLFFKLIFLWNGVALLKLLYDWVDWYSDVWLFTDMSIIVVEWHGLFSNTSQRVGYEDAEGLAFTIKGFWGTVMRFGDVTIQVVSGSHIEMKDADKPKKIELALMKYQGDFLHLKNTSHSGGLKNMLSEMVAQHLRKR